MAEIQLTSTYVTETCCNCGIAFAMPRDFYKQRSNDHKSFYCPKGHGQYYSGKSNEEELKEQVEAQQKRAEYFRECMKDSYEKYRAEKRSKAAHKAHYTMLKRKVKKGQCPCCENIFPDVAEHIRTIHPDYNKKMKIKKK